MENKAFLFLIFLLMCFIEDVKCRKRINCSMDKNEFYLPAGDLCKKCDKCDPGLGLDISGNITFEISEHGAMGCRNCLPCEEGFFSNRRSFEKCKQCKDCRALGKTIKRKCTQTENAKCGRRLPKSTRSVPIEQTTLMATLSVQTRISTTLQTNVDSLDAAGIFEQYKITFIAMIVFVLSVAAFGISVVCLHLFTCRKWTWNGIKHKRKDVKKDEPVAIHMNDIETDAVLVEERIPCLDNAYRNNNNNIAIWLGNIEPTDKQLMFLAKKIAPREGYREVALHLGMKENDISIIEEDNYRCCKSRSYKVLKKWTQLFAEKATVIKLLNAFTHLCRHDVVWDFYQEFSNIENDRNTELKRISDSEIEESTDD